MSSLDPTWLHVTWGAGGSTQERSLDLAGAAQGLHLDTCLHLTCTNMEQSVLDATLKVTSAFIRSRSTDCRANSTSFGLLS